MMMHLDCIRTVVHLWGRCTLGCHCAARGALGNCPSVSVSGEEGEKAEMAVAFFCASGIQIVYTYLYIKIYETTNCSQGAVQASRKPIHV